MSGPAGTFQTKPNPLRCPVLVDESLTTSRDDWHEVMLPADHHIVRTLTADPATRRVTLTDRYGDTRSYRLAVHRPGRDGMVVQDIDRRAVRR